MVIDTPVVRIIRRVIPRPLERRVGRALLAAHHTAPFAPRSRTALRLIFRPELRLLCWPERPGPWQALYKICALNGYRIVTEPNEGYDLAIHFTSGGPCGLPAEVRVLNRSCTDISKRHVARVFERVFGHRLAVDPTTYEGLMVEKSDQNYTHDGRVVEGPIAPLEVVPGRVYQRLVDNADAAEAVDLRTPLYGGRVPFVYVKRRPLTSRFANENASVEVREADEIFRADELRALARFASAMGLDYGELDVLRDRGDGRLYVVDVANTPAGPPNGMSDAAARAAIHRLAREFAALLAQPRS